MSSRVPIFIGGAAVYLATTAAAYVYFVQPAAPKGAIDEGTRRAAFDKNARGYDADVATHEKISGIEGMRKRVAKLAGSGSVLEVAVGTGRNFSHYEAGARVTAVDFSAGMLEVARAKAAACAHPERFSLQLADGKALPFASGSFDAVVDTFGICSFEAPVVTLREMARVTRPGGRIFLLEHGKASAGWLTSLLDKYTPGHAARHGCYWNRDIEGLVKEAGLRIESIERHHLGTTYMLVCSPAPQVGAAVMSAQSNTSATEMKQALA